MQRKILGITLRDRMTNETLQRLTNTTDVAERATATNWTWEGDMWRDQKRWIHAVTMWNPYVGKRGQGILRFRWSDMFAREAGKQWSRTAKNRVLWKELGKIKKIHYTLYQMSLEQTITRVSMHLIFSLSSHWLASHYLAESVVDTSACISWLRDGIQRRVHYYSSIASSICAVYEQTTAVQLVTDARRPRHTFPYRNGTNLLILNAKQSTISSAVIAERGQVSDLPSFSTDWRRDPTECRGSNKLRAHQLIRKMTHKLEENCVISGKRKRNEINYRRNVNKKNKLKALERVKYHWEVCSSPYDGEQCGYWRPEYYKKTTCSLDTLRKKGKDKNIFSSAQFSEFVYSKDDPGYVTASLFIGSEMRKHRFCMKSPGSGRIVMPTQKHTIGKFPLIRKKTWRRIESEAIHSIGTNFLLRRYPELATW
ncbi:hypothetical protein ANN_01342 [Periplaneta americana]|uniref:Uncharacterized protein n=1 Tax=Periplaneta americana TaxID=6978 RepID=A0ABQ8TTB6_PERAM|nr:hypothetical protein ANN_01342 [Periplaneta americana]